MKKSFLCFAGVVALSAAACSSEPDPRAPSAALACQSVGDARAVAANTLASGTLYDARAAEPHPYAARGARPGVDLYVNATQGSSREYLQRALGCHAVYGQALNANDPFHPESGRVASVRVQSAGGGYIVRVAGNDSRTNDEILQRARNLVGPASVQAEQLARAGQGSVQ